VISGDHGRSLEAIPYALLLILTPLIVIAARIRPDRTQPGFILGLVVVVVGGLALVSHLTNQVARDYLAIPLGVFGGLALGAIIWRMRSKWSSRRVEVAAAIYTVAFVLVSFNLDWFDPRGVVPAAVLLTIALLRRTTKDPDRPPEADPISANAAVVFLVMTSIASLFYAYYAPLVENHQLL
jgi:NhaP-type Na+/H+ or K+/H+ antiporter